MSRLGSLPEVSRLALATVRLPDGHPRAGDGTCEVYAYVLHHPVNRLLLLKLLIDERDVAAVVNTHLHFDHCGQNHRFSGTPVYIQQAELDAARDPMFTVAEWAAIPRPDRRIVDGDLVVADGLRLIATPGHTPGHQSVVLESAEGCLVIAGQCGYCCDEFATGVAPVSDMHDAGWHETGLRSLGRLRALDPGAVYFSHDAATYRR